MECGVEIADADSMLCNTCWASRAIYRDELYDLWRVAWLLVPAARRPPDFASHKLSVSGSSAPLDLSVLEIQDRTLAVVVEWANIVRAYRDLHPLRRNPDLMTMFAQSIVWLKGRDSVLRDTMVAGPYLQVLFSTHRELRQLVRGNGGRITGACIQCGRAALLIRNDHVVCLTCGGRWLQAAYLTQRDVSIT